MSENVSATAVWCGASTTDVHVQMRSAYKPDTSTTTCRQNARALVNHILGVRFELKETLWDGHMRGDRVRLVLELLRSLKLLHPSLMDAEWMLIIWKARSGEPCSTTNFPFVLFRLNRCRVVSGSERRLGVVLRYVHRVPGAVDWPTSEEMPIADYSGEPPSSFSDFDEDDVCQGETNTEKY
jgi:hypothetical protein